MMSDDLCINEAVDSGEIAKNIQTDVSTIWIESNASSKGIISSWNGNAVYENKHEHFLGLNDDELMLLNSAISTSSSFEELILKLNLHENSQNLNERCFESIKQLMNDKLHDEIERRQLQ